MVCEKVVQFYSNLVSCGTGASGLLELLRDKDIEPVWGHKELLKFIILVDFITSILAFVITVALYYITGKESFFTAPLSGFHGVIAGFLVALKEILPNLELPMCFFWKIKAKVYTRR